MDKETISINEYMSNHREYNLPTDPFFDRRSYTRVIARLEAIVETFSRERGGEKCLRGPVQTLSVKGLSLHLPIELAVDQSITLEIKLLDFDVIFRSEGIVTWKQLTNKDDWQIGVRFTEMPESSRSVLSQWLAESLRDRSAVKDRRVRSEISSIRVEFSNREGRRLIGMIDAKESVGDDAPLIVLPPAYGETKLNALMPSYYLAANGFRVLRFDATDHVGESDGDMLDCRLHSLAEDLISAGEFLMKSYRASSYGVVASSLAARVAFKAAAQEKRILAVLALVPVVDLQYTLKAVYHEDMIGTCMNGRRWEVTDVLGFPVKGEFLETAITDGFHNLSTTLEDIKKAAAKVVLLVAENDVWVRSEDCYRIANATGVEITLIPGGLHQLFESRSVMRSVLQAVVQKSIKILMAKDSTLEMIQDPSVREIASQRKFERERSRNLNRLQKGEDREFWGEYLNGFDFILRSDSFRDLYHLVGQYARPKSGQRLLDLGCGNGNFTIWLLQYMERIYRSRKPSSTRNRIQPLLYVGVDYVESGLQHATERTQEFTGKNVSAKSIPKMMSTFVQADANKRLPFCGEYFDACVSNLVLSYVEDPLYTLREIYRILKRSGTVVLTSLKQIPDLSVLFRQFADDATAEELGKARNLLSNAGTIRYREMEGHFRFFSGEEMERMMHAAGLVNVRSYSVLMNQGVLVVGEKV